MGIMNQGELDRERRLQAVEDFLAKEHGFERTIARPELPRGPDNGRRDDRMTGRRTYKP